MASSHILHLKPPCTEKMGSDNFPHHRLWSGQSGHLGGEGRPIQGCMLGGLSSWKFAKNTKAASFLKLPVTRDAQIKFGCSKWACCWTPRDMWFTCIAPKTVIRIIVVHFLFSTVLTREKTSFFKSVFQVFQIHKYRLMEYFVTNYISFFYPGK